MLIIGGFLYSRKDGDPDEKAAIVDEEKRPLADHMEPATNGDPYVDTRETVHL